ncbi:hypothetical protein COB52_01600 [Candidatus Kaiserbacteria bacterium]|nr:MAG: hypothetical protein COB52_01600 [Candidatus Kaiserbacteria bacterium]
MGRAMFDDITPPQDGAPANEPDTKQEHSILDVNPVDTAQRQERKARRASRRTLPETKKTMQNKFKQSGVGKMGVWAIAVVVLVVALSAIGFVFIGKTTIAIVPQQEEIILSSNIVHTAYRNPETGELGYNLFSNSIELTDSVNASGKETVEEKASGRIIVYNDDSSAPLRLIKNTRFEAPSGEIYRVRNSFIVPGKSGSTPGSIEITVHADLPGEDKNINSVGTRFTIPGLKGDPRYDTFYAELKDPIIGGFVGERAIVDEDSLNATRTSLQEELRAQILGSVQDEKSSPIEMFDGGVFATFESAPVIHTSDSTATVREIAHIQTVTFDRNELARILITATLASPKPGKILIDSPENLTMTVINKAGVDIENDALIQFTLEGKTTLTWQIDTETLKQDLVGRRSEALNTIMSGYPGIKSAQATIRPFWKKVFPSEVGNISVQITPEK